MLIKETSSPTAEGIWHEGNIKFIIWSKSNCNKMEIGTRKLIYTVGGAGGEMISA